MAETIALAAICFVVGLLVKGYMDSTGKYTDSGTAAVAVLAGFLGGLLIYAMLL